MDIDTSNHVSVLFNSIDQLLDYCQTHVNTVPFDTLDIVLDQLYAAVQVLTVVEENVNQPIMEIGQLKSNLTVVLCHWQQASQNYARDPGAHFASTTGQTLERNNRPGRPKHIISQEQVNSFVFTLY